MKNTIYLLMSIMVLFSCREQKASADGFYGDNFDTANPISVVEMVDKLNESQPIEGLIVKGIIEEVCQAKGCWLTLKAGDDNSVRVTFKDYGFFVPKDVSGKEAIIKGKGQIEITSVADLQHFAKDEGQSEEEIAKITEPLEEITFIAEGVKIN